MRTLVPSVVCLIAVACTHSAPQSSVVNSAGPARKLERVELNRRAAEENLPFLWRADDNRNGQMELEEAAFLWGIGENDPTLWSADGKPTARFSEALNKATAPWSLAGLSGPETERRQTVRAELAQGTETLVETDFRLATAEEKEIMRHLLEAASRVEKLYLKQVGVFGLDAQIPADDAASRRLFFRNQGPYCVAPETEKSPSCRGLPELPTRVVGLYPPDLQTDARFCDALAKAPNAKALMDHFSVVTATAKGYAAVPYSQAFKEDMEPIAANLEAAAKAVVDSKEKAFKNYLLAAAKAFRNNDWERANEAWAQMNARNSKWYVRAAPDEVYYEPCAWKAGFAFTLARINPAAVEWQNKLEPVKQEMEKALAAMAGAPYRARNVRFQLPDFIDIVVNSGDARDAHGATVGQSLPNWGKVADRGGRTVAMTNVYTDADSQKIFREQASSLLCPSSFALLSEDVRASIPGVVFHEAAHNLGPSHDYKVGGKTDDEIFGGPLAAIMEELKAQTASLYLTDWLTEKKVLSQEEARAIHMRNLTWAFGQISRGMYTANKQARTYPQLASMQLGFLLEGGALTFHEDRPAANGRDGGCFEVHFDLWSPQVLALARAVFPIKAKGDKAAAEALTAKYVDAEGRLAQLRSLIAERWLRAPKASFVYSVRQ